MSETEIEPKMGKPFKKTFVAELVELGDMDATGAPTATFQWHSEHDDKDHLAKIEMPEEDLREIAVAFYNKVRITIEYPPGIDYEGEKPDGE